MTNINKFSNIFHINDNNISFKKLFNAKFENIKKISRLNIKAKSTKDKIVVSSFRKGEVIGDHEIIFSSRDEDITIKHTAKDRGIFANGAIQAVKWGMNKKPGLFDMSDVLNIS